MKLAASVILDAREGVTIDGVTFPWYVSDTATVDFGPDRITTINLQLFVDGVVSIVDRDGCRRVIDGFLGKGLGDVGAYARELVHKGLLERLPWLGDVA